MDTVAAAARRPWQNGKPSAGAIRARLVCLDIQPYGSTQANERDDILNVGGFSDTVFAILATFAKGELNADHWVGVIETMAI